MQSKLYALTLHRPWAALIAQGYKTVENRQWSPPGSILKPGEWFAIHAGKTLDAECPDFAINNGVPSSFFDDPRNFVDSAIIAVARFGGVVRCSDDPWFVGPVGWVLTEVVPIQPVACRGAQKLWVVPAELVAEVRASFLASRETGKQAAHG